ncbi:MAG: alpha/beta fold hydrolase [Opitutales bacterium]
MKRLRLWFLAVFAILLLASHLYRWLDPTQPIRRDGQQVVEVPVFDRNGPVARAQPVEIAYRDLRPEEKPDAPVVVLIHGSPVASAALDSMTEELRGDFRLIVPDMPGFGGSSLDIPSYATRAHARYTLALLDSLGIEQAHFVGYSMGGGVLLNVADLAPERVQSLAMIAAIGVQELEMLGDYTLNHALYGAQTAFFWLLREGTPHFGYLDNAILGYNYARNFGDTDQRPFREFLQKYEGPMLLIHGAHDAFVPVVAAREHARLVPQARLHIFDGGHLDPVMEPAVMTEWIRAFIHDAEAGSAKLRADLPDDLRAAARKPMPNSMRAVDGDGLVLLLVALFLGTQITEDLTCIGAGILAARGVVPFFPAVVACFFGIMVGDFLLYMVGRVLGRRALRHKPFKWMISERDIERNARWFRRRGALLIFGSRFVPGSRVPIFFTAGLLRVPIPRFFAYFALAAAIWTPLLAGAAYYAGNWFLRIFEGFESYALLFIFGFVIVLMTTLRLVLPLFSWRGRRLLRGRLRRWTRWEYWPLRLFYTPIFAYIWYLGFKYKSLTAFTACNPALPQSGMIGESKIQILQGLQGAGEALPPWTHLPLADSVEARLEALNRFREKHQLDWPIILKPDRGERGLGVVKVTNESEARGALLDAREDIIAQAYLTGHEYGIFYYRLPDAPTGHILGITDKRLPTVDGDGTHTLEQLILADDTLLAMAPHYLASHEARLDDIPASGETVTLTHVGTHSRGAVFLDGGHLCTPQLEAAIDRIARSFEGFGFGRFDIMVLDEAALREGRDLRIIELNGVTSEVTAIYDPRHSVWHGWRTLFKQWDLAFQIGLANQRAGHPITSKWFLLRQWWEESRRVKAEAAEES